MTELAKSHPENKKLIDKVIYIAAITYPLTTLPQIFDIFINKSSGNVSISTWILYDAFTFIFLWYAVEKRLKPLVLEYCLWIIAQSVVVLGILLYP